MAVFVHGVIGHVHELLVVLLNASGLTFDTAEVDRLFFWVVRVLYYLDD